MWTKRLWWDCTDAQPDLCLHKAHIYEVTFSPVAVQILFYGNQIWVNSPPFNSYKSRFISIAWLTWFFSTHKRQFSCHNVHLLNAFNFHSFSSAWLNPAKRHTRICMKRSISRNTSSTTATKCTKFLFQTRRFSFTFFINRSAITFKRRKVQI